MCRSRGGCGEWACGLRPCRKTHTKRALGKCSLPKALLMRKTDMGQMTDDERRQKMRELRRTMEARRVVVRVQENLRTLRREKGIGPKKMAFLREKRPRLSSLEEKADGAFHPGLPCDCAWRNTRDNCPLPGQKGHAPCLKKSSGHTPEQQ